MMRAIEVRDSSQVAEARRAAVVLAQAHDFNEEDAGRVAIVATELATNMLKHGDGGALLVGGYDDETGSGIECLALDKGAGMANVAASTRDGHSTAGSSGTGLGAVLRGSHATDIYSGPGLGTAILARLQPGRPDHAAQPAYPRHGALSIAIAGEEVCGDGWCIKPRARGFAVMVADGLGHGPYAAEASHAAARSFLAAGEVPPSAMLAAMHAALKPTRGAAIGIADVDEVAGEIVFAGVGNIAATIIDHDQGVRRMVSNNGTIGHIARHMRDFSYPLQPAALIILASDGLATSWSLDGYPGLLQRHPTVIAGVLYRDFTRGRDDVTVFVARAAAA
jgi:anti-sigma regulatory factor (Ser/Thr protein kinase)